MGDSSEKEKINRAARAGLAALGIFIDDRRDCVCVNCSKLLLDVKDIFYTDGGIEVCEPCYNDYEQGRDAVDPDDLSWIMEDAKSGLENCLLNINGSLSRGLREEKPSKSTYNAYANRKG